MIPGSTNKLSDFNWDQTSYDHAGFYKYFAQYLTTVIAITE